MREENHPQNDQHNHHHGAHRPHPEPVVLEIGGHLGALVVFTDGMRLHEEIEISPAGKDARRSHKDVLERLVGSRSVYAAVFDRLPCGEYTLWHADAPIARGVRVEGGAIAEVDWSRERRAA